MITKTDKAKELLRKGEYTKALGIICKFRIGFTDEERRTLTIAHQTLTGNGLLYDQIGIDTEQEIAKSKLILQKKYTELHIF